ncbi:Bsp6I family restriction endonuclease [Lactococcus piscium]|nr:Bsp6I family restriction endonuclease [Lactococcus paracarnosus]
MHIAVKIWSNSFIKKIQVNKKQSLGDQQKQGKRPRFSVIKKIIEPNNLTQLVKVNLRTKKNTK